jgi:hypothetical protein
VFGGIDGFSRLVPYLACATSNSAAQHLTFFVRGTQLYGVPSRVRSDAGSENMLIARLMFRVRGAGRGSHLVGPSVHNQRIERLWRDIFSRCLHVFYTLFSNMEEEGLVNICNDYHIAALQYVFVPRINRALEQFRNMWNNHPMRTCNSLSPVQMWGRGVLEAAAAENSSSIGSVLNELTPEQSLQLNYASQLARRRETQQPSTPVRTSRVEIPTDILLSVDPLQHSMNNGIDIYTNVLHIIQTFFESQ